MIGIKIKRLQHFIGLDLPKYHSDDCSGMDIMACLPCKKIEIPPYKSFAIPTGFCLEIPSRFEGQIRSRSGTALKKRLIVLNSPGTIDADYRGEVKIIVLNLSTRNSIVEHGDRIAQLVISPVQKCNFIESSVLTKSNRGDSGFGSTGDK